VVVNTPARSATGVAKFGSTLGSSLPELGRVLIGLWAINRHRDGVELLKDFMDAMPECRVHVLRNLAVRRVFRRARRSDPTSRHGSRLGDVADLPTVGDRAEALDLDRAERDRWPNDVRTFSRLSAPGHAALAVIAAARFLTIAPRLASASAAGAVFNVLDMGR
jgi:hypothetical protein